MNYCLQKLYYTSIYIFYILFIQDNFKNPKIIKIQQVHHADVAYAEKPNHEQTN